MFFPEPMGVPVGFTYFYLFADELRMGASLWPGGPKG